MSISGMNDFNSFDRLWLTSPRPTALPKDFGLASEGYGKEKAKIAREKLAQEKKKAIPTRKKWLSTHFTHHRLGIKPV